MADSNLERLREIVRKLKALLDDPQPGLYSWNMMYGQTMDELVKFWTEDE